MLFKYLAAGDGEGVVGAFSVEVVARRGGGEGEAVFLDGDREAMRGEELVERVGVVPRERWRCRGCAESSQLHNRCSTSRSLTNWKIKDLAGHTYTFGSYTLGGGSYVKVRTGTGTNTATSRYQGRSWYVWNNDKDTAYLYSATGVKIDTCYYNNRSASSLYC